jgi:protease I
MTSKMNRRAMCGLLAAGPAALGWLASSAVAAEESKRGKVLMPIGDATEVMDTLYPFFRLPEDGFDVVVAGPEARTYHGVLHEIPPQENIPWDITREQPAYHIKATVAFRDVKPADYAGLFLSGGRAPEYLRYDKDLLRLTRQFFEAGKPVAVVCHGVEIVAAAGVLKGRTMTTVAKCALDITQFGGTYVDQPCVIDGNLISARTWHDYDTPFMKTFLEKLAKQVG